VPVFVVELEELPVQQLEKLRKAAQKDVVSRGYLS
jgi:hypothetical protein